VELYRRHFTEAVRRFTAIGNDAGSPWHKLGPYPAARAAVHAVRAAPTDAAAIAEARQSLTALVVPEMYGHDQFAALTAAFNFRADPEHRRGELAELLTAPVLPATAAVDFKDSRLLGRTSDGTPAYLDWITVFGRTPDNPQAPWFEHYTVDQPWKTELNRGLEVRVAEQVEELGRVGRLKRFLAPQLAEMIVSQGDEKILESHRREIVVVFCDLRGYTAFTETAEPEEVLTFLREYHGALGPLVSQYEGTLDQFSGDGIMVFFNDPVPCPDPAERAVKMAMAMREEAGKLIATWRSDGCELGFGAGIAQGYATLGQIGFSERSGYTAIGTVCNLAARLCAEAKDGQILISGRVARAVGAVATLEDLGNLELRGLRRPVAAFNVVHSTSPADARPNLTVVAREPGA